MEFIISYTIDGASHEKVISGNSEVEARASFAHEMKPQMYVITGIELKNPKEDRNEKKIEEDEKTTKEKLDDDEDDRASKK